MNKEVILVLDLLLEPAKIKKDQRVRNITHLVTIEAKRCIRYWPNMDGHAIAYHLRRTYGWNFNL